MTAAEKMTMIKTTAPTATPMSAYVLREEPGVPVVLLLDVARGGVVVARDHHLQRPRVLRVCLELGCLEDADRLHVPVVVVIFFVGVSSIRFRAQTGVTLDVHRQEKPVLRIAPCGTRRENAAYLRRGEMIRAEELKTTQKKGKSED